MENFSSLINPASETKEDGIKRAFDNASESWKQSVIEEIYELAATRPRINVDNVLNGLGDYNVSKSSHRALAGLFKSACSMGWIELEVCSCCNCPVTVESTRQISHKRRISVWKSKIYQTPLL